MYRFGGNYRFYHEQKAVQQLSLEKQLTEAKKQIKKTEKSIQDTLEKHQQKQAQGKRLRKITSQSKLILDNMKSRSEKTQSKNTTQAEQMIQKSEDAIAEARSRMEVKESIQVDLFATHVPHGKIVLNIQSLCFAYEGQKPLFQHFNLTLSGPAHMAIEGKNGSGKTTLVNLILGNLKPQKGEITRGVRSICYLDQQVNFLDPSLSVIENFQHLNPEISTRDAYFALASFNFRNSEAEKQVCHLSGGERIRAGLAISLLSKIPPQLVILDEPTNHLDIRSIKAIENTLKSYQGAIVVISHDQQFSENIGIQQIITL